MATIETRTRADGTTAYRVRYRLKPGANPTADTFDDPGQAAYFADLVDRIGGESARAKREAAAGASSTTITDMLENYVTAAPDLTPGTAREYERILDRSIAKMLGTIPVDLIDRADVERWVQVRAKQVAPKTLRNEHGLLSTLLNFGVERDMIPKNVARGVRLPKVDTFELEILSDQQFLALHHEMTGRYKALIWLLAATGLRWGEATALQWRHISGTQITISQAWKRGAAGHRRELGPPKTARGRRRVETTAAVIESLGQRGTDEGWVFTNVRGDPVVYHTFHRSHWAPAAARAGIDPMPRIHGLRHFAASHMLASGADIFEVSRALGHSDISVTTSTYGHLVPSRTRPTVTHAVRLAGLLESDSAPL